MKRFLILILTLLLFPTLSTAGTIARIAENAIGTGAGVYVGAKLAGTGSAPSAPAPSVSPAPSNSLSVDGLSIMCELAHGRCIRSVTFWGGTDTASIPQYLREVAGPRAVMVQVIYQIGTIYRSPMAIIRYRLTP